MPGEGGAGRLDVSEVEDSWAEDRFGGDIDEDVSSCDDDVDASTNTWFSGSTKIALLGVVVGEVCSDIVLLGEVGRLEFPFPDSTNVDRFVGVGVAGDKPFDSSLSTFSFPFSTIGDIGMEVSVLHPRLLFPGGGGFTANSCAPGIGGGRNEEEGEGKGDEDGGLST